MITISLLAAVSIMYFILSDKKAQKIERVPVRVQDKNNFEDRLMNADIDELKKLGMM
ncbi:hypothetical protein [uncultured Clostridium sp.]|uniref:hypothetical protein n=1 Tax=uncultured Clostridium sp. TaxID=59620 RepID=UPI0025FDD697|nr:hypothetical protein [uncultured Clostridium sp.]